MIKHEEMNIMVQYEQANQDVFTQEQMEMFYDYFKQQEKKDELLELYRKKDKIRLLISDNETDMVDRTYYRESLSELVLKIKVLEEELK